MLKSYIHKTAGGCRKLYNISGILEIFLRNFILVHKKESAVFSPDESDALLCPHVQKTLDVTWRKINLNRISKSITLKLWWYLYQLYEMCERREFERGERVTLCRWKGLMPGGPSNQHLLRGMPRRLVAEVVRGGRTLVVSQP